MGLTGVPVLLELVVDLQDALVLARHVADLLVGLAHLAPQVEVLLLSVS